VSRLQKVCTNREKEKENQEDMRGKGVTWVRSSQRFQ
jgi:hypothetical protein